MPDDPEKQLRLVYGAFYNAIDSPEIALVLFLSLRYNLLSRRWWCRKKPHIIAKSGLFMDAS